MAPSSTSDKKSFHLNDLETRWGIRRTTLYRWRKRRVIPNGDIGPNKRIYSERLVKQIEESGVIEDVVRKRVAAKPVAGDNKFLFHHGAAHEMMHRTFADGGLRGPQ